MGCSLEAAKSAVHGERKKTCLPHQECLVPLTLLLPMELHLVMAHLTIRPLPEWARLPLHLAMVLRLRTPKLLLVTATVLTLAISRYRCSTDKNSELDFNLGPHFAFSETDTTFACISSIVGTREREDKYVLVRGPI